MVSTRRKGPDPNATVGEEPSTSAGVEQSAGIQRKGKKNQVDVDELKGNEKVRESPVAAAQNPGTDAGVGSDDAGLDSFRKQERLSLQLAALLTHVSDPTILLQPNEQLSSSARATAQVVLY